MSLASRCRRSPRHCSRVAVPPDVDVYVVLYFVEGLGHADGRRCVHYRVNAFKGLGALLSVADVSRQKFGLGRQIGGAPVRVDLRVEAVEHSDLMAQCQEAVYQERADESGPPGHENSHPLLAPIRSVGQMGVLFRHNP
jgi:hypothetical protein